MAANPRVEIQYCTRCRAGEVALRPGSGGVFEIRVEGETIWSRQADVPEIKRLVRDTGQATGHSER
jgi:selenoprotein W-related protein